MSTEDGVHTEEDIESGSSSDSDDIAAIAAELDDESYDYFESSYRQKREIFGLDGTKGM